MSSMSRMSSISLFGGFVAIMLPLAGVAAAQIPPTRPPVEARRPAAPLALPPNYPLLAPQIDMVCPQSAYSAANHSCSVATSILVRAGDGIVVTGKNLAGLTGLTLQYGIQQGGKWVPNTAALKLTIQVFSLASLRGAELR